MSERSVAVRLSANVSAYKAAMAEATASTKKFESQSGANFDQVGAKMSSVGTSMNRYVTLPLVAAGAGALKLSTDFNSAFAQMQGLAGVQAGEIDGLKESVLELAGQTAQAPQELADALYFAASAGLDTAQAMDAVTIAAQASQVGLGSTQDVVGLVASAMASYGAANISAAEATDVLVATIREGRAEPAELAGTLGRVLPIAAQLGVSFNEVGGTVAYLSNVFGDTNRTVTATQGMMVKLLSPTKQGRDALADMGTSVEELHASIQSDGLLGALELLKSKGFDQNAQALRALFDDIEGYTAAQGLLGADTETLNGIFAATQSSAGSLGTAMESLDEDGQALSQAWVDIQVALIQVGEIIGPVMSEIAGGISSIAGAFGTLPDAAQMGIVAFGLFLAALGPVLKMGGAIVSNLASIRGALILMRAAMLGHPILALATVAAAVGGALYFMSQKADESKVAIDGMAAAMEAAGSSGEGLADWILTAAEESDILMRTFDQAGVTVTEVASAAMAGGAAWNDMSMSLAKASRELGQNDKALRINAEEQDILGGFIRELPAQADAAAAAMARKARVDDTASVAAGELTTATDFMLLAMGGAADHTGNMVEVTNDLGGALGETAEVTDEAAAAWNDWESSVQAAVDVAVDAYNEQVDAARKWADDIRSAVDSGSQSFLDIAVDAETSVAGLHLALQQSTADNREWESDLATIRGNITSGTASQRDEFIGYLSEMGAAGAPMVDELSRADPNAIFEDWVVWAQESGDGMIGGLDPVAAGMEEKMKLADGRLYQQMLIARTNANVAARQIGAEIPAGMAVGITQGQSTVDAAISGMVSSAIAKAKKEAGIESPSKLFRDEVGRMISQGVAEGIIRDGDRISEALGRAIESAEKEAISASEDLVDAALDAMSDAWRNVDGRLGLADMQEGIVEAQANLDKVMADPESTAKQKADALERLQDAHLKLSKATQDDLALAGPVRDAWIANAAQAGLTAAEINGLVAAYDALVVAQDTASTTKAEITNEAAAAQKVRTDFDEFVASGLISDDQLNHISKLNASTQVWTMQQIMDAIVSKFPKFHSGGVVPGSWGTEVPILAQAGERIVPAGAYMTPAALTPSAPTQQQYDTARGGISIGTVVTADDRGMRRELETMLWAAGAR